MNSHSFALYIMLADAEIQQNENFGMGVRIASGLSLWT
jgi:hypothetical protein